MFSLNLLALCAKVLFDLSEMLDVSLAWAPHLKADRRPDLFTGHFDNLPAAVGANPGITAHAGVDGRHRP